MSNSSRATTFSTRSSVARILVRQGSVFAMEERSSFDEIVRAAKCGFPRTLVETASATIKDAIERGETLSRRTIELKGMLDKVSRTAVLLRRAH